MNTKNLTAKLNGKSFCYLKAETFNNDGLPSYEILAIYNKKGQTVAIYNRGCNEPTEKMKRVKLRLTDEEVVALWEDVRTYEPYIEHEL